MHSKKLGLHMTITPMTFSQESYQRCFSPGKLAVVIASVLVVVAGILPCLYSSGTLEFEWIPVVDGAVGMMLSGCGSTMALLGLGAFAFSIDTFAKDVQARRALLSLKEAADHLTHYAENGSLRVPSRPRGFSVEYQSEIPSSETLLFEFSCKSDASIQVSHSKSDIWILYIDDGIEYLHHHQASFLLPERFEVSFDRETVESKCLLTLSPADLRISPELPFEAVHRGFTPRSHQPKAQRKGDLSKSMPPSPFVLRYLGSSN